MEHQEKVAEWKIELTVLEEKEMLDLKTKFRSSTYFKRNCGSHFRNPFTLRAQNGENTFWNPGGQFLNKQRSY